MDTPETCPIAYDHESFGECAVCGGTFGMLGEPLALQEHDLSDDERLLAADPSTLSGLERVRRSVLIARGDYAYPRKRVRFES